MVKKNVKFLREVRVKNTCTVTLETWFLRCLCAIEASKAQKYRRIPDKCILFVKKKYNWSNFEDEEKRCTQIPPKLRGSPAERYGGAKDLLAYSELNPGQTHVLFILAVGHSSLSQLKAEKSG